MTQSSRGRSFSLFYLVFFLHLNLINTLNTLYRVLILPYNKFKTVYVFIVDINQFHRSKTEGILEGF